MRILICLALACIVTLPYGSTLASEHRPVDVRPFDIAGVKTGMDYNEARAAAAAHFRDPPSEFKTHSLAYSESPITHAKIPRWFTYEKNGIRLQVNFVERTPFDKAHPAVVDHIIYELPRSTQNEQAMEKAALEKYGEPTFGHGYYGGTLWCAKPNTINPGLGCNDGSAGATLKLSGTKMELRDGAWFNALQQAIEESKTTKPNF